MHHLNILPIQHFASVMGQTWYPKEWKAVKQQINPWADEVVDRLNLLIVNYRRMVAATEESVIDWIFTRDGWRTELIVHDMNQFYADELRRLLDVRRQYVWNQYGRQEAASFDVNAFMKDWEPKPEQDQRETESHFDSRAWEYDAIESFVGMSTPSYIYNRSVIHHESLPPSSAMQLDTVRSRFLRSNAPWAAMIRNSWHHLLWEFAHSISTQNALSGAAGKGRALFVNHTIPKPTVATILAWWDICGLDLRCTHGEPWFRGSEHFFPGYVWGNELRLAQYAIPGLPMTQEHVGRSPLPGEDSQSDHSLPFKSSGHTTDSYGRIQHGRWEVVAAMLSLDKPTDDLANTVIVDSLLYGRQYVDSINKRQLRLFPSGDLADVNRRPAWPWGFRYPKGQLGHPWYGSWVPGVFGFKIFWDDGLRALAKWNRIHLRFDEDEIGGRAMLEWRKAFESSLAQWLAADDTQRTQWQLDAALERQNAYPQINESKTPGETRGRKPIDRFGFSAIWDDMNQTD